jgi:hypothetical protein
LGGKVLIYDLKDAKKKVRLELKGHDKSKRINALLFTRVYKPSSSTVPEKAQLQKPASVAVQKPIEKPLEPKPEVVSQKSFAKLASPRSHIPAVS